MTRLKMLLAATLISGSATLLTVASPLAAQVGVAVGDGAVEVQYGERDQRGKMFVRPDVLEQGDRVRISARDLRPFARLVLSAGRNPARLDTVRAVQADANGRLFINVRLPDWARPGRNLFFALETRGGRTVALSRPIRVVDSEDEGDDRITVTGELLEPTATCPRLAGDDGRIYALAGSLRDFDSGDRVRVTGEMAETSICNQRRTIDVERIRSAE